MSDISGGVQEGPLTPEERAVLRRAGSLKTPAEIAADELAWRLECHGADTPHVWRRRPGYDPDCALHESQ